MVTAPTDVRQVLDFVEELGRISDSLRAVPMHERQEGLQNKIKVINTCLPIGLYLPLWPARCELRCFLLILGFLVVLW